jgi:DNA-damage-inducible protein J
MQEGIIMAMTNINVRTDSEIKARAQQIFESMGLDMSTAVNIFLRQTVRQNDLPFGLTARPHDPVAAAASARAAMFGCLRGKYVMADDFDAPLDDFKDYMQ